MQEVVVEFSGNMPLLSQVARIYDWLNAQVAAMGVSCNACGECCDFTAYNHRLFITSPEIIYLAAKIGPDRIKPMQSGRCPYNIDSKCSVYESRFAGCRIFCCNGEKDFQSELSEKAIQRFKSLCDEFGLAYHYMDLARALNSVSAPQ